MTQSARPDARPRNFRLIIFDWDGTAVPDRRSSSAELILALERVLLSGIKCAIITGTNYENLSEQGIASLNRQAKRHLFVCTNRGSEVFEFDEKGASVCIYRRTASTEEDQSLDEAIRLLEKQVNEFGLETKVVSDRMNRRKLDLIPEERWADPKKKETRELFLAVQARLRSSKIEGGLRAVVSKAVEVAHSSGLPDPRVTSDIKHVEIGLTDKSDSVRWLALNVMKPGNILPEHAVVFGDEFGEIGGVYGSDSLMRVPELHGATFVSVGVEPEGAPPWVEHLAGGPRRFIQFLNDQAAPPLGFEWSIKQHKFDPTREREMESIYCIGNGYLGLRGTPDFLLPVSQPDLFLAGVYDRKAAKIPYSETVFMAGKDRHGDSSELVPFPNPFYFTVEINGVAIDPSGEEMPGFIRSLDLMRGICVENHTLENALVGKMAITSIRCAASHDPHLLLQRVEIHCEGPSRSLRVDFGAEIPESELRYPHVARSREDDVVVYRTSASNTEVAVASTLLVDGKRIVKSEHLAKLEQGQATRLERAICVYTSRDVKSPAKAANSHVEEVSIMAFSEHIEEHVREWSKLRNFADIQFDGRPDLTRAWRFNMYHLLIAAGRDPRASIGARALTGRAYEGHVFWDAEIFLFPFFLHTVPAFARNMLLYRYNTLGGARHRALEMGFRGACFAWESTVTGEDVTPKSILINGTGTEIPIFTGRDQIHITADVAYAVWKYWGATADDDFIADYGAEILFDTARFWRSRVVEADGMFHVRNVVGPDEYHHSVDDNAYTNVMARFNLEKAFEAANWMRAERPSRFSKLIGSLELSEEEIESWAVVKKGLFVPVPGEDGVIEQFAGFKKLESVPITEKERLRAPIQRLFNWEQINRSKVIKQADLLMIPFLFPFEFKLPVLRRQFEYYEPLTDHGSSLSMCVFAAVAARCGFEDKARHYWEESLNLDLHNKMSNTELGIHVGAMGGGWQALVFHMLGVRFGEGGGVERFAPAVLPDGCTRVRLNLVNRNRQYRLAIGKKEWEVA